jgi:hypothetical protein
MARRFRKDDIETRWEFMRGRGNTEVPAINVKVYSWAHSSKIEEHFKCSEEVAERSLQFAFESAQEVFWENIQETAEQMLGASVKVYQSGRSGGWLVVDGLPEVESWDAILVSKWGAFEKAVKADINDRMQVANLIEDIEANRWAEEYAQRFNFLDTPESVKCIADLRKVETQAVTQAREQFFNS